MALKTKNPLVWCLPFKDLYVLLTLYTQRVYEIYRFSQYISIIALNTTNSLILLVKT